MYVMRFEDKALSDMDQAVKNFVFQQFQQGKSLAEIISATRGELSWAEWPAALTESRLEEIPGVTDVGMTDEQWLAKSNEVVVIYRSFYDKSGIELHFLQNSFRATSKRQTRSCASLYVILRTQKGPVFSADLYTIDHGTPGGESYPGWVPRLLDFWQQTPGEVPSVLVYYGPNSNILALEVSHYTWNPSAHLWEGSGLWGADTIVEFYYDPQTTTLVYYSGYMEDPAGEDPAGEVPNVLAPPKTVNLKDVYRQNKEVIEEYRKKNVLKHSPLSPPKQKYVKGDEASPDSKPVEE